MTIISFVNIKGGTGKTTSTINIAGELARRGKRVLLIDNDPQSNLTQILFGSDKTFKNYLYNVYQNPNVKIEHCVEQYSENIFVVPNCIGSSILEKTLSNRMSGETALKQKISSSKLCLSFDYILIDNSPFLGKLTTNALVCSDYYNIVIDTSTSALLGIEMVDEIVKEIRESMLNNDLKILGVIKNNFDFRNNYTKSLNGFLEKTNKYVFKTHIPTSIKYKESFMENKTIQEYSYEHSEHIKNIVDEMVDRIYADI